MKDINSGKINNMKTAKDRYLKDIYPDKKFLKTSNIVDRTLSHKLKKIFEDFEYAVFGVFLPTDTEPKKSKKTRRKWIKNNDIKTNNYKASNFASTSKSR